jgi:hypothetical protein
MIWISVVLALSIQDHIEEVQSQIRPSSNSFPEPLAAALSLSTFSFLADILLLTEGSFFIFLLSATSLVGYFLAAAFFGILLGEMF